MFKEKVLVAMRRVFADVPPAVDHTLRVLKHAESIMEAESFPPNERELVSVAAILHDIGILEAQKRYGSMEARYQEAEGAVLAREVLQSIGYDPVGTERVCHIVGHHHTFARIDGLDFQIIWEADLLENLPAMEIINDKNVLKKLIDDNFKTLAGKALAYQMFCD